MFFLIKYKTFKYHPILGFPAFTLHNCYIKQFFQNFIIENELEKNSDVLHVLSVLSLYLRCFNIFLPLKIVEGFQL